MCGGGGRPTASTRAGSGVAARDGLPRPRDGLGSAAAGVAFWDDLTGAGGEGMVVKPLCYLPVGRRGLAQPAVKCRGREYLRIIYGPTYDAPGNIERLRSRA